MHCSTFAETGLFRLILGLVVSLRPNGRYVVSVSTSRDGLETHPTSRLGLVSDEISNVSVSSRSRAATSRSRLGLVASEVAGLDVQNEVSVSSRSNSKNTINRQIFTSTNIKDYTFRRIASVVVVISSTMITYYETTSIKYSTLCFMFFH